MLPAPGMIAPPEALVVALAGRYEAERELGQGGMAAVFLARDLKHHRQVAIKVVKPELAASRGAERFLRPGYLRQTLDMAQRLLERAIALESTFALAHAALSQVHGEMSWFRYDPSLARAAGQRAEAEEALRLAPGLPEAHVAMGNAHYLGRRDWRAALDEIERLLSRPSWLSVHTLRLDPRWDPIRNHPRFNALLEKYGS